MQCSSFLGGTVFCLNNAESCTFKQSFNKVQSHVCQLSALYPRPSEETPAEYWTVNERTSQLSAHKHWATLKAFHIQAVHHIFWQGLHFDLWRAFISEISFIINNIQWSTLKPEAQCIQSIHPIHTHCNAVCRSYSSPEAGHRLWNYNSVLLTQVETGGQFVYTPGNKTIINNIYNNISVTFFTVCLFSSLGSHIISTLWILGKCNSYHMGLWNIKYNLLSLLFC